MNQTDKAHANSQSTDSQEWISTAVTQASIEIEKSGRWAVETGNGKENLHQSGEQKQTSSFEERRNNSVLKHVDQPANTKNSQEWISQALAQINTQRETLAAAETQAQTQETTLEKNANRG